MVLLRSFSPASDGSSGWDSATPRRMLRHNSVMASAGVTVGGESVGIAATSTVGCAATADVNKTPRTRFASKI